MGPSFKEKGFLGLSQPEIALLQPTDTVLSDMAAEKMEAIKQDGSSSEPFFLAVGFR